MFEHAFEPGDVVRLKSGGPEMTVAYVYNSSCTAICEWFDLQQNFNKQEMRLTSLRRAKHVSK